MLFSYPNNASIRPPIHIQIYTTPKFLEDENYLLIENMFEDVLPAFEVCQYRVLVRNVRGSSLVTGVLPLTLTINFILYPCTLI